MDAISVKLRPVLDISERIRPEPGNGISNAVVDGCIGDRSNRLLIRPTNSFITARAGNYESRGVAPLRGRLFKLFAGRINSARFYCNDGVHFFESLNAEKAAVAAFFIVV